MAGKSKGRGVRSSRSLRFLFASGILRGSGSGKGRSVSYSAKRAKSIAGQRKRGVSVTKKYRNTPKGSTRPVIGGKTAGLRGGGGTAKRDFSGTRAQRIAAGREKAQAFVKSERGQKINSAVNTLRETGRRTGRRDYDKPAKVKAAKADLKAAGVKVKTGTALSNRYDTPRLRGDYSRPTTPKMAPKYARQVYAAKAKSDRAEGRAALLGSLKGKSRADRIAAGKGILARSGPATQGKISNKLNEKYTAKRARGQRPTPKEIAASRPYRIGEGLRIASPIKLARRAEAAAKAAQTERDKVAATRNRLRARENRVARGEAKKAAATAQRLAARNRRVERLPALERGRRIKAGQSALAAFRERRDSLYNSKLF